MAKDAPEHSSLIKVAVVTLICVAALVGCSVWLGNILSKYAGRTIPYAQALEVTIRSAQDRHDLAAILRDHAKRHHLYFRDWSTRSTLKDNGARAVHMIVYRPLGEDEFHEVRVDDRDHLMTPWIVFVDEYSEEQAALAGPARRELVAVLSKRFPDIRNVPVSSSGGLANRDQLRLRGSGYCLPSAKAGERDRSLACSSDAARLPNDARKAFCLSDATTADLGEVSIERLRGLHDHYEICTFDRSASDAVVAELARRGDAKGLYDAAVRLDLSGEGDRASPQLERSADLGYASAIEGLAALQEGGSF